MTKRFARAPKSGRKTKSFDAADDLTSPELIEGYLDEAIATGDPDVIRLALGNVARARRRLARRALRKGDRKPS
jgi:probable addiction module antidote protein